MIQLVLTDHLQSQTPLRQRFIRQLPNRLVSRCLLILSSRKPPYSHSVRSAPTAETHVCGSCQGLSEKAAVMTYPCTFQRDTWDTEEAHTAQQNTYIELNTHKAPKPLKPVLQPSLNLNLIPTGTSIRAAGDKVGHQRQAWFYK